MDLRKPGVKYTGYWATEEYRWVSPAEEAEEDAAAKAALASIGATSRTTMRLWVYGGMRPGGPLDRAMFHASDVTRANYPARRAGMVVLGVDPGLYHDPSGPEIPGHLYRVTEPLMRALDAVMVGYTRKRVRVVQTDGVTVRAWCHFPSAPRPDGATPVPSGDWLEHVEAALNPWRNALKALRAPKEPTPAPHGGGFARKKGTDGKDDNPWRPDLKLLAAGERSTIITGTGRRVTWECRDLGGKGKHYLIIKNELPGEWGAEPDPGPEPCEGGPCDLTPQNPDTTTAPDLSDVTLWQGPRTRPLVTILDTCSHCGTTIEELDTMWIDSESMSPNCLIHASGHEPTKPWWQRTLEDWQGGD